jgi:S1-C subfamily serine protease
MAELDNLDPSSSVPPPEPHRPRSHRGLWTLVAAVVTTASVGVAAIFGLVDATSATSTTAARAIASSDLTASAIAADSDAAIVDITTSLRGGEGAGTGMVLTPDGQILTNYHVVKGATDITVTISNGSDSYSASVVGVDETADVALLDAKRAEDLATVDLGDGSDISVGDRVVAIGNANNEPGDPAVTEGTVTALERSITVQEGFGDAHELVGLIEIDAQLEPGNSGGPLFNADGEVIGITTAAETDRFPGVGEAEGYAIPIDDAVAIVRQIESGESTDTVRVGARAYLGVEIRADPDGFAGGLGGGQTGSGVLVAGVETDEAADRLGIEAGNRIVAIDGTSVDSPSELSIAMNAHEPGERTTVEWLDQDGEEHQRSVRLGTAPIA